MRALHRRSQRGIPKPQGAFRGDATPRPCQGCAQAAVPACPRCGHHVCPGCAALRAGLPGLPGRRRLLPQLCAGGGGAAWLRRSPRLRSGRPSPGVTAVLLTPTWVRWIDLLRQQSGTPGPAGPAGPQDPPARRARQGRRATSAPRDHRGIQAPGPPGRHRGAGAAGDTGPQGLQGRQVPRASRAFTARLARPSRSTARCPRVNGASVLTATALVPTGARIVAVLARIDEAFSAANGLTAIQIGDATLVDGWGVLGLTVGPHDDARHDAPRRCAVRHERVYGAGQRRGRHVRGDAGR